MVSPIGSAIRQAMTQITGKSGGDSIQASLQMLGMDQRSAAMQGAMHDLSLGNLAGYQKNLFEAFSGVDPGRIGAHMAPPFSAPPPSVALGEHVQRVDLANKSGGFGAFLAGAAAGGLLGGPLGALLGGFGANIGKNIFSRSKAKTLEKRLNRDPMFRAQFEASVGGRYVPDGRRDGKITIVRPNFGLPGLNPGMFGAMSGNLVAGGCLSGLARMMGNATSLMGEMGLQGYGGMNTGIQFKQQFGLDRASGGPGSAVSRLPPNATFEDLVAAFMIDTVKDMQDEAKAKMDEIRNSNRSRGRGRGGYGGAIGGIAGVAGSVFGGMVGGPIGSQIGGQLGGAVGGAVGGQGGAQGGDDSRNLMFEELKNIMNKLQQMQQALSNVLNTMHQGAMNSIRNIRA